MKGGGNRANRLGRGQILKNGFWSLLFELGKQ